MKSHCPRARPWGAALPSPGFCALTRFTPIQGRKGPGCWLPPAEAAHRTYATAWAGTKLRWKPNTDEKEHAALVKLADACPDTVVEYEVVP